MQVINEQTNSMIDNLQVVNQILEKNGYNPAKLIPILQQIQEEFKYLSKDVISYVANSLNLPASKVYGVATFYAHFSLTPKGKYVFRLCDGTACHVKKSHGILNALYAKLNINAENNTSKDMLFTVETVSCLGACGLAPVMVVNGEVHGQVTPEQAIAIVDELIAAEKAAK